jgi:hypothetical protein
MSKSGKHQNSEVAQRSARSGLGLECESEPLKTTELLGESYSLSEYKMICTNLKEFFATLKRWADKEDRNAEANSPENPADQG